jgi:hypothetical protein
MLSGCRHGTPALSLMGGNTYVCALQIDADPAQGTAPEATDPIRQSSMTRAATDATDEVDAAARFSLIHHEVHAGAPNKLSTPVAGSVS